MVASIKFYNVGNGDMSLLTLQSGKNVLVDINIRAAADDSADDSAPDVFSHLVNSLPQDEQGRPYVDVFLLTHPDADHCRGLEAHFHLGTPESYNDTEGKVFIREMWSSPIVFRRKQEIDGELCSDAAAWRAEAKRRVNRYKAGYAMEHGNRIQIMGADRDGKTDDIQEIVVEIGQQVLQIAGELDATFTAKLLGPLPSNGDDELRELLSKNHSSIIMQFTLVAEGKLDACKILMGGDAEVAIWERLWEEHQNNPVVLEYDILLAPHHCSWHSLSYEGWSDSEGEAEADPDALAALSQARKGTQGPFIIASSNPIEDDDIDPPCIGAKWTYEDIMTSADGEFFCVSQVAGDEVLEFKIKGTGPYLEDKEANQVRDALESSMQQGFNEVQQAREQGSLRVNSLGIVTAATTSGIAVPRNTFFGDDPV